MVEVEDWVATVFGGLLTDKNDKSRKVEKQLFVYFDVEPL